MSRKKIFLISLGVSLGAALLILLPIFFLTRGEVAEPNEVYEVFAEEPPEEEPVERFVRIRVPLDWEYEGDDGSLPEGYTLSILTGLPLHEDYAQRRPLAAVINNIRRSLPQSGIASADVIYEVLAEGDVTRMVAIFQSYYPEKIGSIRSARDYFIDFAFNHDGILVFHGASPSGHNRIRNTRIDNVDGGAWEGRVFWRDRTYPHWALNTGTRPQEHSSYTGREQMESHIEDRNIRSEIGDDPNFGFNFGELPEEIESLGIAHRVVVPFSSLYTRTFIFDEDTELYMVEYQNGPLRDALTAEQVSVTNILIQITSVTRVAGDAEGRRNVVTTGSGRGYLVTGGEHFPVRWEKASHTAPMRWYFEDDQPLILSAGRTWICVFQTTATVTFE